MQEVAIEGILCGVLSLNAKMTGKGCGDVDKLVDKCGSPNR